MKPANEPDWDDLRYFLAAARARSLVGAARALKVEHTTVGRRLSALERALGAALMLRAPDGLRLTRLGARLLPRVEELERAVVALREQVRSEATRVRIAVPSGFTRFFTVELGRLCQERPDLTLEILSGARHADLFAGEADMAVRSGPMDDQELVARKLGEAGFSLYGADAYLARRGAKASADTLRGHDLIAYHESLAKVPAARWLEQRAAGATVVLRSSELADMLTACVDGVGLAVLPCCLADTEPRLVRLTPEVVATRPLWLVYRPEAGQASEVRAVMRFVVEVMKQNAATLRGDGGPKPA